MKVAHGCHDKVGVRAALVLGAAQNAHIVFGLGVGTLQARERANEHGEEASYTAGRGAFVFPVLHRHQHVDFAAFGAVGQNAGSRVVGVQWKRF